MFNFSIERGISDIGSFQTVVVHCRYHNVGQCGMIVLTSCVCCGLMLYARYGNNNGSHTNAIPSFHKYLAVYLAALC